MQYRGEADVGLLDVGRLWAGCWRSGLSVIAAILVVIPNLEYGVMTSRQVVVRLGMSSVGQVEGGRFSSSAADQDENEQAERSIIAQRLRIVVHLGEQ